MRLHKNLPVGTVFVKFRITQDLNLIFTKVQKVLMKVFNTEGVKQILVLSTFKISHPWGFSCFP